ncbi:hypothetical protein MD484_g5699, partial [Candolleomyces efflorescens]
MTDNAAFFAGAHGFSIQNLQFNTHQTTITRSSDLDPALQILHKNRALEACHTSKTAANAAKCKEGTQVEVIKDITTWADDPDPPTKSILWLRGPAGGGKTCVMRAVASIYHGRGRLAGVYFFSTRVPGLDNGAPIIATFAWHLLEVIPALVEPVLQTIRSNPTIFDQSLEYQLEKLVSNQILSVPPEPPMPRLLVIDGFDECRDPQERAHLLRIIHSLVTPPHSFRVIMASRPEFDIRTAFDLPPLNSITKILRLEEYDISGEIYQHLSDEFDRIQKTHPAKQSIPVGWPGKDTLRTLTRTSSGIWTYPSTVIKYVDNPRRHPGELLKHVIDASSNASSRQPFAELDALYKIVLEPPDVDILLMKRLLHIVAEITRLSSQSFPWPFIKCLFSTSALDDFLSYEKGTTEITLCDLHSVLSVADSDPPYIHFYHKSLEDYLCSPERSGKLHQPRGDTQADIMTICAHHLQNWNSKLVDPNANLEKVDSNLSSSCYLWQILLVNEHCFPLSIWDFDTRIISIAYFGPEDESLPVPPEIASVSRSGNDQVVPVPSLPASPLAVDESKTLQSPPIIDPSIGTTPSSVGLALEPAATTSLSHAPSSSTPISAQDGAPTETLSPETQPDLHPGEAAGVDSTAGSPAADHDSELFMGLAGSIFIWLVIPFLVVSFAIHIFMRTDIMGDM